MNTTRRSMADPVTYEDHDVFGAEKVRELAHAAARRKLPALKHAISVRIQDAHENGYLATFFDNISCLVVDEIVQGLQAAGYAVDTRNAKQPGALNIKISWNGEE